MDQGGEKEPGAYSASGVQASSARGATAPQAPPQRTRSEDLIYQTRKIMLTCGHSREVTGD